MIQYKNNAIFFTGKDKKTLTIKLRSYLAMNDFMLIDIINKNAAKRKIYLTQMDYLFEDILKEKNNIFQIAFN
jgi:hypothetical protein